MSQVTHVNRQGKYDRAFILGVLNGVLFNLAEAMIGGTTVLPIFVSRITESKVLIGLSGTMGNAGWFMPQLLVASQIEHLRRKMPIYIWSGVVRLASMWAIAALVALAGNFRPVALVASFFTLFATYSLAGGVAGIPFMDIVARTVPPERRGTYFAARLSIGGVCAALAGILVRGVLESRPFPASFALLFCLAAVIVTAAVVSFAVVREPEGPVRETRMPFMQFLRKGPFLLKNVRSYRMLLVVRIFLGVWGMALPFYVIFAQDRFPLGLGNVGVLLSLQMAGAFLSNILWGYLSNHVGNKIVLVSVSALSIVCPVATLATSAWVPLGGLAAFGAIFFLIGASWSGISLGYTNYMLDVSPAEERPTYLGFMNTFLSPVLLLGAVGGIVVDRASYGALFGIALAAACGALLAALQLEEPRRSSAGRAANGPAARSGV
ncbi:MAG: MFS transporter [bacterium]